MFLWYPVMANDSNDFVDLDCVERQVAMCCRTSDMYKVYLGYINRCEKLQL